VKSLVHSRRRFQRVSTRVFDQEIVMVRPNPSAFPLLALALAWLLGSAAEAQERFPSNFSQNLLEVQAVRAALDWMDENFPDQVEEWIRITEIPAPSGMEGNRARYLMDVLEAEGVPVRIDEFGNVVATLGGTGGGPNVVIAAHMDTVHPLDVDLSVNRDGDILRAPGVFDNSASVANMLAVIRAWKRAGIQTRGDVIFIGTVEEEVGLVGMTNWLEANPGAADMVIALDGGLGSVSYGALWFSGRRYIFRAEGAHTLQSWGRPNPAVAMAEVIRSIYEIPVPGDRDFAVYNVGMVHGGSVRNAIPQEVWFTVDLRAVDPALVDELGSEMDERVSRVAEAHGVDLERDPPMAERAVEEAVNMLPEPERRSHPLVQTAVDVYAHLGIEAPARNTGSTDAVAAVRLGIPAIAMGRSHGGDQHTLREWAHVPSASPAAQAILLVAVSMAELDNGRPDASGGPLTGLPAGSRKP
jgi:tripeptide aminopeptidase